MAWFNSGLNSIKGQLSNLAQEVLADADREEEAIDTIQALDQAQTQCEELAKICSERDLEIASLRKQIAELQSRVSDTSVSSGAKSTKSVGLKNVSLEDSWYWADNAATNSSESDNEKRPPQAERLKKLQKQNKALNEKILRLEEENNQLNVNLEELDTEHQLAIQNVLELKSDIQQKYTALNNDYESLKKEHANKFLNTENEIEELRKKYDNLQVSYTKYVEENVVLKDKVEKLNCELANNSVEHANLNDLLSKKDTIIAELKDEVNRKSESEKEEKTLLEDKIDELAKELELLRNSQLTPEKKLSESSSGKQSVDDDFIVVPVLETDTQAAAIPKKEEFEEKIDQLNNQIAELVAENSMYQSKIQDLEMEKGLSVSQLEMSIEELKVKLGRSEREVGGLQDRFNALDAEKQKLEGTFGEQKSLAERLLKENQFLKLEMETINENMTKCEANASDVESKLMMENVDLQKKLIDMESSLNQTSTSSGNSGDLSQHIRKLLSTYTKIELSEVGQDNLESAFKQIRDKIWQIEVLEKNLSQMSEEILDLQENKLAWDHEKKTLEADIGQYIIQCDELMKNNEILLNELENYKRNKLETISENNEENLLLLENQLDECRSLNTTLEEEYRELNDKISELENEKQELVNQLNTVQDINSTMVTEQKILKQQLEALETEKSNLLFEFNEMKSGDRENEVGQQLTENKEHCANLEKQIERLNADLSDAVQALQTQKLSLLEAKKEIEQLEQQHRQKDITLSKMDARIQELSEEDHKGSSALESLKIDNEHLQKKIGLLSEEKASHLEKLAKLESDLLANADLQKTIESLNFEKNEIIKTLQSKHSENMQYYMEIQRLSQLLQSAEQEKTQLSTKTCEQCEKLTAKITSDAQETEKLQDQITFLREKSDILTSNLLTEQTNQKLLQQEKAELAESNANLRKDLERLREHLVELEESHTQETIEMQSVIDETKAQMSILQGEVSKSSNAYTSASIRANQHAETLQAQYALVTQQRDELVAKLSLAEDRESKNQAALVNLQCALEQFQNDKDNEIKIATQKIRRDLESEQEKQKKLEADIAALNQQLADANQGLRAASRLSDQLESSQMAIAKLNEEVRKLMDKNTSLSEELSKSESSQTDKIDKNLIKSLVIGYVVSGNINDKNQVLRMITSVLDFNQNETDKVGLNKQQSTWFGSIIPPIPGTQTKDNLVQAFVHFLEQESQPRSKSNNVPNLLNITTQSTTSNNNSSGASATSATSSSRKSSNCDPMVRPSTAGTVQPILLNTTVLDDFTPSRNSSSILKDILSDS
ncbi:flagellar attachment zone protein 1 [Eupeodes corollae]|uniref:flagellar attachment zone protein 1 n=1 Tax=Eupeodes corollae TaxID=290404 RepID=UPI00248FA34D|nr:flagellar attachment zone protein 1 [Eupeodes corollae]